MTITKHDIVKVPIMQEASGKKQVFTNLHVVIETSAPCWKVLYRPQVTPGSMVKKSRKPEDCQLRRLYKLF